MQLRPATLEDIPAILALIRRVIPAMRASGNLQWDDDYPTAALFANDVALAQLWLAMIPGQLSDQVAGVAAITTEQEHEYAHVGWDITEPAIVVHRLAVDPAFRGRGVASALMQQAEHLARAQHIAVLRADTSAENDVMQRLFPRLGYTFAGEVELEVRPGLRIFCYEKRLAPSL